MKFYSPLFRNAPESLFVGRWRLARNSWRRWLKRLDFPVAFPSVLSPGVVEDNMNFTTTASVADAVCNMRVDWCRGTAMAGGGGGLECQFAGEELWRTEPARKRLFSEMVEPTVDDEDSPNLHFLKKQLVFWNKIHVFNSFSSGFCYPRVFYRHWL